MQIASMIKRHLEPTLCRAAEQYPVVCLTGLRQSGKTTLVRQAFPNHQYVSLELPEHREFAQSDPRGFLGQFAGSVIFDEIQRVPSLFSYIQDIVDRRQQVGQFILTGWQNFLLLASIGQSLAGRCATLHLLPFSRAELAGEPNMDLAAIGKIVPPPAARPSARTLFETLFTGGHPAIFRRNLQPQDWLRNYYQAYVERDVREILNVGDIETFGRFVRLCAGRCGQLLNLTSLGNDAGISHSTARKWLSALEASFIILLLRPHYRNFNKRLVKSPKLYFLDSGLLCYLLRIRGPEDLRSHGSRGNVFESWVVSEIVKNYLHRGLEPGVYFWRDSTGHEIDLLIERGEELVPVEAKSGETFVSDFLDGIRFWRGLTGQKDGPAAVVYGGATSYLREGTVVTSWQGWP
jgi:predicted AAA+ superfamily ATPase